MQVDAAQATLEGAVRAASHRFKSPQLIGVRTVASHHLVVMTGFEDSQA
jgi:hypothetical protein